jgi:hypothetical protein
LFPPVKEEEKARTKAGVVKRRWRKKNLEIGPVF